MDPKKGILSPSGVLVRELSERKNRRVILACGFWGTGSVGVRVWWFGVRVRGQLGSGLWSWMASFEINVVSMWPEMGREAVK